MTDQVSLHYWLQQGIMATEFVSFLGQVSRVQASTVRWRQLVVHCNAGYPFCVAHLKTWSSNWSSRSVRASFLLKGGRAGVRESWLRRGASAAILTCPTSWGKAGNLGCPPCRQTVQDWLMWVDRASWHTHQSDRLHLNGLSVLPIVLTSGFWMELSI